MNNDAALILLLADRQREIEALRARVAELEQQPDPWLHLPNGRKVTQVGNGQWVAADEGGWLPGARDSADAWQNDL